MSHDLWQISLQHQRHNLPNKKAKIIYFRQLVSISLILCVLIQFVSVPVCADQKSDEKFIVSVCVFYLGKWYRLATSNEIPQHRKKKFSLLILFKVTYHKNVPGIEILRYSATYFLSIIMTFILVSDRAILLILMNCVYWKQELLAIFFDQTHGTKILVLCLCYAK